MAAWDATGIAAGAAARRAARRSPRHHRAAVSLGRPGVAAGHGRAGRALRGRGLPPHPGEGRGSIRATTSSASRPCSTCCRRAPWSTPMPTRRGRRPMPACSYAPPATSTTCSSSHAPTTTRTSRCAAACDRPFVLDESIDSLAAMLRAHRAGLIDGVTLKIAAHRRRHPHPAAPRRRRRTGPAGDDRGHRRRPGRHRGHRPPLAQHARGGAHAHGRLPPLGHRRQRPHRHRVPRRHHDRAHRARPGRRPSIVDALGAPLFVVS